MIRAYKVSDFDQIREIHEKHYKHEFSLEEFNQRFIEFFVIEEDLEVICAGGIRTIAESVIMTNKDASPRARRNALYQMLDAQTWTCSRLGYTQLHAFIQDSSWERHLEKIGFKSCKGNALFLEVK
jgi:hypothetical protein